MLSVCAMILNADIKHVGTYEFTHLINIDHISKALTGQL